MKRMTLLMVCILVLTALSSGTIVFAETASLQTDEVGIEALEMNRYNVQYYNTNDPSTIIAEDVVDEISINYSYSDFHGIDSQDFGAHWVGQFEFEEGNQVISISQSWSQTELYIDDELVYSGGSDKELGHYFTAGTHKIEVVYENNWHTTTFQLTISDEVRDYTLSELTNELAGVVSGETQVYFAGVYDSSRMDNSVDVTLKSTTAPVVLFLNSYDAVKWVLTNPNNVNIEAVIYQSYTPGARVEVPEGIQVYKCSDYAGSYTYENTRIEELTGKECDGTTIHHNGSVMSVPEYLREESEVDFDAIPVNRYQAQYYDSTDPYHVISEGLEDEISLSYNFLDGDYSILGIDYRDFGARWTGKLECAQDVDQEITINQESSACEVYVDDELVYEGSSSLVLNYHFTAGVHKVEVVYANNDSQTAKFQFGMGQQNQDYSVTELSELLNPIINQDTELYYAGVYESSDANNEVEVVVQETSSPVVLFLSSHDPVKWAIQNSNNVQIEAIVYRSYASGSSVIGNGDIPVYQCGTFTNSNTYDLNAIVDLTNYECNGYSVRYRASGMTVPAIDCDEVGQTPLNQYKVRYFDASNPLVTVAEELVDTVSVNYIYADFHGIDSYDFDAEWIGYFDFATDSDQIISLSQGWSNTQVYVDDELVYEGGSSSEFKYHFTAGVHKIVVVYENNWHTTQFVLTIKEEVKDYSCSELSNELAGITDNTTKFYYVGAYESDAMENSIQTTLKATDAPVVLFLSSYDAVKWVLDNPNMVDVKAVVYRSYAPGAEVATNDDNIAVYKCSTFTDAYEFDETSLREAINEEWDGYTEIYSTSALAVPEVELNHDDDPPVIKDYTKDEIRGILNNLITRKTKLYYAGVCKSTNVDGSIDLTIGKSKDPVVLVVTSDDPVVWNILNPYNTVIKAVVYSSTTPGSEVLASESTDIYYVSALEAAYEFNADLLSSITSAKIDAYATASEANALSVPEEDSDKGSNGGGKGNAPGKNKK